MKHPTSIASPWLVAACCLAGLGLLSAPARLTQPLRTTVRDGLRPGQTLLAALTRSTASAWNGSWWAGLGNGQKHNAESAALRQQMDAIELKNRQMLIENANLRNKLNRAEALSSPLTGVQSPAPLFEPQLVRAQVLGEELAGVWRGQKLIGAGAMTGLMESSLVLDDPHPLIDQGADAHLAADLPVYAGRIVVGKIGKVGRWSSTLRLVTDKGYAGAARLGRRTSRGMVFGAEGKLEGDGQPLCRLRYIQSTEPVLEGDPVFTGEADGLHPVPMFYGTVARAELEEGTSHWLILVKPAIGNDRLDSVQVLRTPVNRNRILAQ